MIFNLIFMKNLGTPITSSRNFGSNNRFQICFRVRPECSEILLSTRTSFVQSNIFLILESFDDIWLVGVT